MTEHLSPALLHRFLNGEASNGESRTVVAHLLTGCPVCLARTAPGQGWLAGEEPFAVAPPPETEEADSYDLAIQRAFEAVRLHGVQASRVKAESRRVLARLETGGTGAVELEEPVAAFEALLARSWSLRHDDPQAMVQYARLAVRIASRIRTGYDAEQQADLVTRGLCELANALRVADEFDEATEALQAAEARYVSGTAAAELGLRIKDVRASLVGARHDFAAACALLSEVHHGRLALGDRQGAARALLGKGFFTGLAGETAEAFRLFDAALALCDEAHEPRLRMIALHNKLLFLVDASRLPEALELLDQHRSWLWKSGGPVDRAKLLGIEGRIHARLGHLKRAEGAFRQTKEGFADSGVTGHEALITLDLASIVMRQGRNAEATNLALEALQVFERLKIRDQVAEAVLLLSEAVHAGLLTAGLLESVAEFVRHAEHNRRARYQPRFD